MISLNEVPAIVIILVVIGFVASMGATVEGDLRETQCDDVSGTFGNYPDSSATAPDGSHWGCCSSVNSSNADDCDTWANVGLDYNITSDALEGLETVGDWQPTIALVVIFAIIIGLLVGFLWLKGRGGGF